MASEAARAIALSTAALLAACGPENGSGLEVPGSCYGEGTSIEIEGVEAGDVLQLYYGLQGGQHVYAPVVLRGVDPRTTSVRVELTRELDGQVVADQVFTRFVAGTGECEVALPMTELFVSTPRADGLAASMRVVVFDAARTEMRSVGGVCLSSEGACGDAPQLALRANGVDVSPGDRVFLDDAHQLRFSVDPASHEGGALWGRIGAARVDSSLGSELVIDAEDGGTIEVQLLLSSWGGPGGGGLIAAWSGELAIGCDVLGDGTECQDSETCDRGLAGEPSRCRAAGGAAPGEACTTADDCAAGATCVSETCRAWCDPAAPECGAGEACIETLDVGLCQPT